MGAKRTLTLAPIALLAVSGLATAQQAAVEPGEYLSPIVQLQRLQGANGHLHVDEVRLGENDLLLQCSYDFGVVDIGNPARMRYLAQRLKHTIPGDDRSPGCIHLAPAGDVVYTTHRGNLRNPAFLSGWDITDPREPVQIDVLQEEGISYEGVDVAGDHIFVGLHEVGLGVYRRAADGSLGRVGLARGLRNAWGVVARGERVYVADGPGGLALIDASDPAAPEVRGTVETGGLATGVDVRGDLAFVAAGAGGLVIVDVSDIDAPQVIGRAPMPGSAIRVQVDGDHAYVAAWNDARVYDVSNPAAPRFVASARHTEPTNVAEADRPDATSRVLGIAARGNDVFVGNWHVLYSYRLFPERQAPSIRLPESSALVDFGAVDPGAVATQLLEVTNQGTAPLTLVNVWVAGEGFDVTPDRKVIEPGGTAELTVTHASAGSDLSHGYLQILSDDPQAPLRRAYLVANRPGLGVGMPLPETTGMLLDGRDWVSTEARGTVTLLAFFATF